MNFWRPKLFFFFLLFVVPSAAVAQSNLPPCPPENKAITSTGAFDLNWNNCFGTQTDRRGSKYTGEFVASEPSGQGTLVWPNGGTKYVGEFRDGIMTENGTWWFWERSCQCLLPDQEFARALARDHEADIRFYKTFAVLLAVPILGFVGWRFFAWVTRSHSTGSVLQDVFQYGFRIAQILAVISVGALLAVLSSAPAADCQRPDVQAAVSNILTAKGHDEIEKNILNCLPL